MNGTTTVPNAWEMGAILLGRFSAWMGSAMAPVYGVGFVISLTQASLGRASVISLSTLPPSVGLALALMSWMMAATSQRPLTASTVLGVMTNASSLSMAALLPILRSV